MTRHPPIAFLGCLAPASADPIVRLYREVQACQAIADAPGCADADAEAAIDRVVAIEIEAARLRAASVSEAIASLQWARSDFIKWYRVDGAGRAGDDLFLALLDGALGMLRRMSA